MASVAMPKLTGSRAAEWEGIRAVDCALVIERREAAAQRAAAERLLADAPFERIAAGRPDRACNALGQLPEALREDIHNLVGRFAALMGVDRLRIRLEALTTNSCRRIHADQTDLRLITTYAGPATQVLRQGAGVLDGNLWSMKPGWIGLFKGRLFGEGHAVCLHRSPPAGDLGERRLVLVVDTPAFVSK